MKKIIMVLLFNLIVFVAMSQKIDKRDSYEIKASAITQSSMIEYGAWTNWDAWTEISTSITISNVDDKITIHGKVKNIFSFTDSVKNWVDRGGDEWIVWETIDSDGKSVTVRFVTMKDRRGNVFKQMCFDYGMIRILYYIEV